MGRENPMIRWGLHNLDPKNVHRNALGIGMDRGLRSLLPTTLLAIAVVTGLFLLMVLLEPSEIRHLPQQSSGSSSVDSGMRNLRLEAVAAE